MSQAFSDNVFPFQKLSTMWLLRVGGIADTPNPFLLNRYSWVSKNFIMAGIPLFWPDLQVLQPLRLFPGP
ncbi:MAG TPA: hypothetical protein ENH28_04535 [Euryarchaeota archaeon]|nr:hypothetical protein [Euryarchaeota archaeon]